MRKLVIVMTVITGLLVASCNSNKKKNSESTKKELSIGMEEGWAEGVAMSYVAKDILQREGYDVKIQNASVDLIFTSLHNGDLDVFMDVWLPKTHAKKLEKYPDIDSLGVSFDNAKIGLVVPDYVTINSIEELNANKAKFDGKIIGIESGAGITAATKQAIKDYHLDFKLMTSSSIAMLSELQKAIQEKRWVVVTGWAPHWKFGRFQLKFLEDPKKDYGETERIETYSRKGFKKDDPTAAAFFSKIHFDDATMADLLAKMEEGKDNKEAVAKAWVDSHQELVNTWLGK